MSSPSSSAAELPRKRVAIVQSSYVPWKGFFDLVSRVDELILLDDTQYTRRDWRNRNRIKTPQGIRWLTIPVRSKWRYLQRIDEVEVSDPSWRERHWETLRHNYARTPGFVHYREPLEHAYLGSDERLLTEVNRSLIETLCELLGIDTRITRARDYDSGGRRSERLVALCRAAGAGEYLSGPTARAYLDEQLFADAGIGLNWMDYSGYPTYPQPHPPFEHAVSVLDLLFSVGPEAPRYLHSGSEAASPEAELSRAQ